MGDLLWPVVVLMLMLLGLLGVAIFSHRKESDDRHDT